MIRIVVSGAAGKMGRETLRAVWKAGDIELVGAVDPFSGEIDAGVLMDTVETGILVRPDLERVLEETKPDIMIDFTSPESVYKNICTALKLGVRPVVGTTGMSDVQLNDVKEKAHRYKTGCVVAPNFAIGALLMMKFAAEASKYFPNVEIIEMHHDKKVDAPSGTAVKTAELINLGRGEYRARQVPDIEKLTGARGAEFEKGIRIHSVRLPGLMAHQEVIFGGLGQTLNIRHDSMSRESFMPGVLLAVRKVMTLNEMVYGLESVIFEGGIPS